MFERVKKWFSPKIDLPVDDELLSLTDDEFLEKMFYDMESSSHPGPVMLGMGRNPAEILHACQIARCVRPSAFTVMTTVDLDVDIPFSTRTQLRGKDNLPTYKQYLLCDRHYAAEIRGKAGTAYVVGPQHVYDPDTHEETKKKLAKIG